MKNLNFKFVSSIQDIRRQDWDRLFGKDLIESYGYHKSLQEAGIPNFEFGYLVAERNSNLVFIAPFFVTDFSFTDYSSGLIFKIITGIQRIFPRFLRLRILFFGAVTAEELYLGIDANENSNELLDSAIQETLDYCRLKKISAYLFYNVNEKRLPLRQHFEKKGLIRLPGLPSTIMEIGCGSLKDYIHTLTKNARKDLKKKLRPAQENADLITEVCDNIEGISEEIYRLYLNNFTDARISFELLPKKLFVDIAKNMPGLIKYFVTRQNDKIVAFNLCIISGDFCIDKFIGIDPEAGRKYHLYFTTLCHNIDWCIKNGIRYYQPGATDYYPKIRLGAKLIPLSVYASGLNPLLHLSAKALSAIIAPQNLDPSLKESRQLLKNRPAQDIT